MNTKFNTLNSNCSQKEQEFTSLRQSCSQKEQEFTSLRQSCDQKDQEFTSLRQSCDQKDQEFTSLRQSCDQKDQEFTSLRQSCDQKDQEFTSLRQSCDQKDGEITDLIKKLNQKDRDLESWKNYYENLIQKYKNDLDKIRTEQNLQNTANTKLNNIRNSISNYTVTNVNFDPYIDRKIGGLINDAKIPTYYDNTKGSCVIPRIEPGSTPEKFGTDVKIYINDLLYKINQQNEIIVNIQRSL